MNVIPTIALVAAVPFLPELDQGNPFHPQKHIYAGNRDYIIVPHVRAVSNPCDDIVCVD